MKINPILLDPNPADGGNGTPPAPAATTPPAGYISLAERDAAIEKARVEERAKLNSQVENYKSQVAKLTDAATAKEAELVALTGKYDVLAAATKTDGAPVDLAKVIEEVTTKAINNLNKQHQEELKEVRATQKQYEKRIRDNDLAAFKAKAIADAGGPDAMIVQLVNGNNEEEITASVKYAVETFSGVLQRQGIEPKTLPPQNAPGSVPPTLPTNAPRPSAGGTLPKSVKSMTPQEWAASRKELLAATAQRYGGQ